MNDNYAPMHEGSFIKKQIDLIREDEEYMKNIGKIKKTSSGNQASTLTNWNKGGNGVNPARKVVKPADNGASIKNFEFAANFTQNEQRAVFGMALNNLKK